MTVSGAREWTLHQHTGRTHNRGRRTSKGNASRDEARGLLRRIEAFPVGTIEHDFAMLNARLGLNDLEGAMTALETVARSGPRRVSAYGLHSVAYDPLRADPRFAAVLRQINLDVARLTLPDGGRSR
jgi:hypothetical protein